MSEPFFAEIRIFGFNFAPVGWATCDGQVLPIAQNQALFSLLGTTFGGNGRSTFALPNLAGSFAIGTGQGPGLTDRTLGDQGGSATVALSVAQMPQHTHGLSAASSASTTSPAGAALAPTGNRAPAYRSGGAIAAMAASSLAQAGQSQPHENRQPALALNFCIALQGIYPPRP